ncbi:MAG TPA: cadmium-translocating P-type ATPase [Polaromonas sp.]|uniref:heavy metal translocating P-type ATPase n=1 Tax=Polaromonas sp. UBA4122 TaxID=1947074 RepID=UPI000EBD97BF|nr:heavy metal translocating P-type ATPase [Polaromonas sp. UBA4122]HAL39807.1 cadmium-translocating P-type ATPase [Polaromonas sp.]
MTEKLSLQLALVLPGIPDERDSCIERLTVMLQAAGLEKVHIVQQNGKPCLCLHYDPTRFSLQQVRSMAQASGAQLAGRYQHELMRIDGMDCSTCATVIEHALHRLDGVLEASVSYAAERMRLEYDTEKVSRKAIVHRLEALGYKVLEADHEATWYVEYRELIVSAVAGALLLSGWLVGLRDNAHFASLGLLGASLLVGGYYAMRDAWQSIRERQLDIDVLMIVAAMGAAALGKWAEGALLLVLFSLGHALEHLAMDRARHAIEALADLAPKTALVLRNGVEVELAVEALLRGDTVLVRPGQRIPADGKVLEGSSAVDQAAITGESMPVDKTVGAAVFAGTVNGEGLLTVEVSKLSKDSSLARMVQLVAEAQTEKSPTQRFVTRFEKIFVPLVLVGVVALIVVPLLLGMPFSESFYRAMAVLVAASPCALAIATPSAVLAGVARAARGGVLIKGGVHLENLRTLSSIAFDKTGTITTGKPSVTDVIVLEGDEASLLATAASVESRSGHPLAQAVVQAARARKLDWPPASDVQAITGKGMHALVSSRKVSIGNLRLFERDDVPDSVRQQVARLESLGKTTMLVRTDGVFVGLLALADTPRPGMREVFVRLASLGVRQTIMLTGDNEQVAKAVAASVGISDVRAGLLPEEKLKVIDELMRLHGQVAMVGDGVNDAPAMARATIGIAMGGAGTDVALETADVALMADDLSRLPFAIALSRASHNIIQQNLWVAFGVVALLIPATLFGWASMGIAVLIHEGATVLVVLNALRLLRFVDAR